MTTQGKKAKSIDNMISGLAGTYVDPIIVYPGGWGNTLPEWLKAQITLERLEANMQLLKGKEVTGTDAEACAYLYTASLTNPMSNDWASIYLYIAAKTYARANKPGQALVTIEAKSLNDYQAEQLTRLRGWLYWKRTQARQDKERVGRRQEREEAAAKIDAAYSALFEF